MSTFLDILAYNTHFKAFYLNLVGNESFLSTAIRRDSVVGHAKLLSYLPSSVRSAVASVDLILSSDQQPNFIDVPADLVFIASSGENTFTFHSSTSHRVYKEADGTYKLNGLQIFEGKRLTHSFDVDVNTVSQGVIIPNVNVDTELLRVFVKDSSAAIFEEYTRSDDIVSATASSKLYYVSEVEGSRYNVYFGDNVLSKALEVGGKVRIDYVISSGPSANLIKQFSLSSSIPAVDTVAITNIVASTGGSSLEDIDSVKARAPRFNTTQNRAVTSSDYVDLIQKYYPNADDVISFGGEKLSPPKFGKTFAAVKPKNSLYLSEQEKANVKTILDKLNVVGIVPQFVDVDYIFVDALVSVTTNKLVEQIGVQQAVTDKIQEFNTNKLSKFDRDLRYSVLVAQIDQADSSIISNATSLTVAKRLYQFDVSKSAQKVNFGNQLVKGTVTSTEFTYNGFTNCVLTDSGSVLGKMDIVSNQAGVITQVGQQFATIDYQTGQVDIPVMVFVAPENSPVDEVTDEPYLKFTAKTTTNDVYASSNQIILIGDVVVTVISE